MKRIFPWLLLASCAAQPPAQINCDQGHAECAQLAVQQTLEQAAVYWPLVMGDGARAEDGPQRRHYTDAAGRTIVVYFQYHTLPALVFEEGRLIGWPHRMQGLVGGGTFAPEVRQRIGEPQRIHSFRSRMEQGAYRIELWFYGVGEPALVLSLGHVFDEELGRALPEAEPRMLGVAVGLDDFR